MDWKCRWIDSGNRTEWSPIRSVIIQVINKIGQPRKKASKLCTPCSFNVYSSILTWLALLPFWNGELTCQASYSWQFSIGLCCKDSYFRGKQPCPPPTPTPPPGSLPPSQQRTVLNLPFWDSTLLIYIPFSDPVHLTTVKFHLWVRDCVFSPVHHSC